MELWFEAYQHERWLWKGWQWIKRWNWKFLCCQTGEFKCCWKLPRLGREKRSILTLMIRYALQQNLTRAVNSPVAFKSSITSAVVRSFSVVTRSVLVTLVCSMAFVNVWSKKNVRSILDVKFALLMPLEMLENPGRKMDYWLPQQGRHRPTLWLTHHCTYKYTGSGSVAQGETFEQINQIIKSNNHFGSNTININ